MLVNMLQRIIDNMLKLTIPMKISLRRDNHILLMDFTLDWELDHKE